MLPEGPVLGLLTSPVWKYSGCGVHQGTAGLGRQRFSRNMPFKFRDRFHFSFSLDVLLSGGLGGALFLCWIRSEKFICVLCLNKMCVCEDLVFVGLVMTIWRCGLLPYTDKNQGLLYTHTSTRLFCMLLLFFSLVRVFSATPLLLLCGCCCRNTLQVLLHPGTHFVNTLHLCMDLKPLSLPYTQNRKPA